MCPLFRIHPGEEASPRAKANIMRSVLSQSLPLQALTSAEFRQFANLCFHCHMCRLECPARVDIPRLMRDSKGAYVAANGLTFAEWAMVRLDLIAALAGAFRPVANWALGNRQMRWLLARSAQLGGGVLELSLSLGLVFFFYRSGPAMAEMVHQALERLIGERAGHAFGGQDIVLHR